MGCAWGVWSLNLIFQGCVFFINEVSLVFDNFNFDVATFVYLPWKVSHGCFGKRWYFRLEQKVLWVVHSPSVLGTGPSFGKPPSPNTPSHVSFKDFQSHPRINSFHPVIVLSLWAAPSLGHFQNTIQLGLVIPSGVVGLIEMQFLLLGLVLQTPTQVGLQLKGVWEG